MEETLAVTPTAATPAGPADAAAAHVPKQRGDTLLDAAVRYAGERHWDVFPGAWLEVSGGVQHCSCGRTDCPAPGAHPMRPDWADEATGSASTARRLWSEQPAASILLPTGRTFDVIDVPESAGLLALARMRRMELPLGPVTRTPDRRVQFFVLPGEAAKVPGLLRGLGRPAGALGLTALGEGRHITAPPTRFGGLGIVQWAARPTPANRWLPDAEQLLPPLTYACARDHPTP